MNLRHFGAIVLVSWTARCSAAEPPAGRILVGPQPDGRVVVPTNQILSPAGQQVLIPGRPTDLALSPDKRYLAVANRGQVLLLDAATGDKVASATIGGASYRGILFSPDGRQLFVSTIPSSRTSKEGGSVACFHIEAQGKLVRQKDITFEESDPRQADDRPARVLSADETYAFGSKHLPAGMAWADDGRTLLVALNLANQLAVVDAASRKVLRRIATGNAPYDVTVVGAKAYVTNFAGRLPRKGDLTGPAGIGPVVRIDPRTHVAAEGSISIIDWRQGQTLSEIVVGPHASAIVATPDGRYVAAACANDDLVWVVDTASGQIKERISTRPANDLLFGSAPGALSFSPDGRRLFVACGTSNAVAVIEFDPGASRILGFVPVGWYPSAVLVDSSRSRLLVANVKGIGSRENESWQGKRIVRGEKVFGYNSHDYLGSLSFVRLPEARTLTEYTATVLANNRRAEAASALAPPRPGVAPRPVPERHGEPSVFQHVVYIVKENRTYDQVFGDVQQGEGDPTLCIYGRQITPNHHKLVDDFVLLDNFYCSGVLSADGHQWAMEAYVTDYLERAFGGFPRSYPYDGGDALAYAPTGFLWDNVLAHKKSLRVYGEFVEAEIRWRDANHRGKPAFLDCYRDFLAGNQEVSIRGRATIRSLDPYICPTTIGFPSTVPDVYRAAEFIKELNGYERDGSFPNLSIVLLPNDHTAGTRPRLPTPEAAVADNDLALGRMVEAISRSRFWPRTCIFVVEDDPQNGFDHIDGHRTVALVVSPYTRRHAVDSTNYNQTSMVRTIELILGLPPMHQLDATATPMSGCFRDEADPAPYEAVPNLVPLDRMNPDLADIRDARQLHWAQESLEEPLDEVDEADEDTLNRILWYAARRNDATYPAWAVSASVEED